MLGVRSLISGAIRARPILLRLKTPIEMQSARRAHDLGPPQPFSNLPFTVHSRYATTFIFAVLFGVGLWAPFLIVWYSMAKRTL